MSAVKRFDSLALVLLAGAALIAFTMAIGNLKAHATGSLPGYYVAEHDVHDLEAFGAYAARVRATLEPFGGRVMMASAPMATVEGEPPKGRIVVIMFDSLKKAQGWYESAAYQEILPMRLEAARSRAYFMEGLPN